MQLPQWVHISLRICLAAGLVLALNLASQPHRLADEWLSLRQAETNLNPALQAASLVRLAQAQPWRDDLWRKAMQSAWLAQDWQLGIDCLERLDPHTLTADDLLHLGDAYLALGQPESAVHAWESSIKITETIPAHTRLYEYYTSNQDFTHIRQSLAALHRLQPSEEGITYLLVVHQAAFQPAAALDILKNIEIQDEVVRSQLQTLQTRLRAAALEDNPTTQILAAGQALGDLGEWQLAFQAFQQSVQMDPGFADAWAYLGEARQHLSPAQTQAALADLRHALRLNPKSIVTLSLLALYWQRQGDLARAGDLYRSVTELEPHNPTWYAALGGVANAQGALAAAEAYYRQAVTLAPGEAVYPRLLASFFILNQVNIHQGAIPAALEAVRIDPQDPANLAVLGQAYLMDDDPVNALLALNQALALDENYAPAHLYLGTLYLYQGDSGLAEFHLLRASEQATDPITQDQAARMLRSYFP